MDCVFSERFYYPTFGVIEQMLSLAFYNLQF